MNSRLVSGSHRTAAAAVVVLLGVCTSACLEARAADPNPRAEKPAATPAAAASVPPGEVPRLAFVGLHGGIFEALEPLAGQLGLAADYLTDEQIHGETVDFARYRLVFLQHTRDEDREPLQRLILSAKKRAAGLRVLSLSDYSGRDLVDPAKKPLVEHDPQLHAYYGSFRENLRRMLVYVSVKYLHRPGEILPPETGENRRTIYHPDYSPSGMVAGVREFLEWSRKRGWDVDHAPRAVVTVHSTHLAFQQPKVVDALLRAFEKRGVLAVAMFDLAEDYVRGDYASRMEEFRPQVVIHTCHSGDSVEFREKLGVPHLHSIFFRTQSIRQWHDGTAGLPAGDASFQITAQELLGAIEPQIGAGTQSGGGSSEAFTPIPERIEHLVGRAASWIRLARIANRDKKVAIVYYDCDLGKAELMRGTATGMFMNGPRSAVNVLKRMQRDGYSLSAVPGDENELLGWLLDHGRQIGVWAPGVLDRLARNGSAVLVPAETYRKWFESKVPPQQQKALIQRWGEPPGKFLVWQHEGKSFLVIPRIDLGNVILLPQPLRGEAHDTSLIHDKLVPPPHNYLATYFWLQESFRADAVVHFGTHGTEFILPGRASGLSEADWPDIVLGTMPNVNPWIVDNLGESSSARRRAYAVLIDYLVPPSVGAGLSDALLNLSGDIEKWETLDDGSLKEKFRAPITRQTRDARLDRDLHIDLPPGRLLSTEEIRRVEAYLHDIHDETTTVNLHVFGEPPPKPLLVPWLVTCLGQDFLDRLGEVLKPPPQVARMPSGRRLWLRQEGEKVLDRVVFHGFSAIDALRAEGAVFAAEELPKRLRGCFDRAAKLQDGFAKTPREIDGLMAALNGRFIPPGPGNSPDRNPAVLPTGRNMYVMNPEEVPSRPSWEIGKQLIEQLLAQQMKSKGRHPQKVAFTLDSFATFQDYGVMESQILYLLGVRPVWDERNCVTDVELIPAAELGRPRIDVFISAGGYYRDILPTRMRLLDKAIRLVAARDEPGNNVYGDSVRVAEELRRTGADPQRAAAMSQGRMFGPPPGQIGGGSYYYLVERSGQWNGQKDLMDAYLSFSRYIYTGDLWGVEAPRAYDRQIQGSEVLLRSWSDRTRSALSNKYDWYLGGSLSLAIKQLTGREPEWFISDVRDADRTSLLVAEDALSRDFHVRLLNRKWIEGMMKEGYAGADQIAVHVSNALGWSIMRQGSVSDDTWNELAAIYVQDKLGLSLRRWFDTENPYAFQDASEVMLEAARKGYWNAPPATLRLVAQQYAQSVVQHGEGGGLRGGGNAPLERFVVDALHSAKAAEADRLAVQYQGRLREAAVAVREVASGTAPGASLVAARLSPAPGSFVQPEGATGSLPARASPAPADKPPAAPAAAESKSNTAAPATIAAVRGNKLQPAAPPRAASEHLAYRRALIFGTVTGALLLIVAGFLFRRGAP